MTFLGLRRLTVLAAAAAGVAALAPAGGAAPLARTAVSGAMPLAHAARSCSVGSGRQFGYTYVTSLYVSRTKCSTGTHLVKRHGHVRGWRCHTKTLAKSPVQYEKRETCTRHRSKVVWGYSQNR